MNPKHISLAFAAVAALLAGCAKSSLEGPIDGQFADLELSYVGATETKAAIDGTTFPTEGEIGLFLFENEQATTPYGDGYINVKYSYNSTKSKWTASPSIKVGSTPGYLYGYYPYSSAAADIKAIPVSSSFNGDDVMYAAKQSSPITDVTASQTTITMNHALARVSVKVINNGYTGNAKLSQIKFEGAKLAASGTLDATNGNITATKADEVALSVPTAEQTIATGDGTTYECLLVPSEINSNRQDVTLSLTIDGEDKSATLSGDNGVIFAQGTQSNITITLSNSGISVQTISVESWNVIEVGGHKVTVKLAEISGIEKDIMFTAYVEGASVIIKAYTESGRPIECVLPEDRLCDYTKNNNIYTFTISDITSDLTATVGYVVAHSVSLNKDALKLIKKYGHYWLFATVLPEEAEDKTLIWSSSDEKVATVSQNGFVQAIGTGSALITAKAKVGGLTATCPVTVVEPQDPPTGALPGYFSVSDSTVVYFSKGNLYCSGVTFNDDGTVQSMANATWGFEAHQYDTTPSENGDRDLNHISHFMWCNSAEKAMALRYDSTWDSQSPFFAEKNFSVGEVNTWSTLTRDEWSYLFSYRRMKDYGRPRYTNKSDGITIEGTEYHGLFIYPDDYDGMVVGDTSETWTWKKINDAGIVFLPAAGYSNGGTSVSKAGEYGYYWSASALPPHYEYFAFYLNFLSGYFYPTEFNYRYMAYSVRLVTECK